MKNEEKCNKKDCKYYDEKYDLNCNEYWSGTISKCLERKKATGKPIEEV